MKQLITLIVTLLIVIGSGIWELSYLKESSRYFLSDISNVYQIAEREDYELAKNEANKLQDTWKEIRKTWALFIHDSHMDEVGGKLVSFVSYVDSQNKEEIKHSYKSLSSSINSIVEFECLKPENIF